MGKYANIFRVLAVLSLLLVSKSAKAESLTESIDCSNKNFCITVLACAQGPDGDLKTFSTPCQAICAGYQPLYYTECKNDDWSCPTNFKPVCGTGPDGLRRTYNNRCEAKVNEAKRISRGACPARGKRQARE